MGWCDDVLNKKYNKLIKTKKNIKHEKLYRTDNKYNLLIPINIILLNQERSWKLYIIHLTQNYKLQMVVLHKKKFF